MKRIEKIGAACLLAALVFLQVAAVTGAEVGSLSLNQVQQDEDELTMYVNLYDDTGSPVTGTFESDRFAVSVDGVEADVVNVRSHDPSVQGIHYVFVVDVSLSMTDTMMGSVRDALNAYVDKMGPLDTVTVISFGEWVTEVLGESGDKEKIKEAISSIVPEQNWTALYEGVISAAKDAAVGRSLVVVITDGKNELADPGASPTKDDIMAQIQSAQVPLYCIGLNDNEGVNKESLIELAEATGGAEFDGPASAIGESLDKIYGISCGAIELNARMTNLTGKSEADEAAAFSVSYETGNGPVQSNELRQVINWSQIPSPTPAPTHTPASTATPAPSPTPAPTPTLAPTAEPTLAPAAVPSAGPQIDNNTASKTPVYLVAAGIVILAGVLVGMILSKKSRKNRETDIDIVGPIGENAGEDKTEYEPEYPGKDLQGRNTGSPDVSGAGVSEAYAQSNGHEYEDGAGAEETELFGGVEETAFSDDMATGMAAGAGDVHRGITVTFELAHDGYWEPEPRTFFLEEGGSVTFGRTLPADIAIEDHAASRKHFRIGFDGERLLICDLGSKNGTWVNGERLGEGETGWLRNGDTVQIGATFLCFYYDGN